MGDGVAGKVSEVSSKWLVVSSERGEEKIEK